VLQALLQSLLPLRRKPAELWIALQSSPLLLRRKSSLLAEPLACVMTLLRRPGRLILRRSLSLILCRLLPLILWWPLSLILRRSLPLVRHPLPLVLRWPRWLMLRRARFRTVVVAVVLRHTKRGGERQRQADSRHLHHYGLQTEHPVPQVSPLLTRQV
jgi:hypothetical protein